MTNMSFSKEQIKAKLKKIKYRGPDNSGFYRNGAVSMGHLRLSIIDLEDRSNQPYKFKKYSLVYNGEIYNFDSIKTELEGLGYSFDTKSDTEVLIKAYDAWGKKSLFKFNGMFAFAIYNEADKKIFAARDRLGVKPFYYYYFNNKIEICSQIGPLISSESKICEEAVSIYLDCGYIPSPYSIIKNIHKLEPGKFLEFNLDTEQLNISNYWDLKNVNIKNIKYENAKIELHELLKDAVKIRMKTDVPFGSFLSGGVDSALITSIASSISDKPIKTYTIGFDDPKYDESSVAKSFSEILGTDHTEITCTAKDVIDLIPKLQEVYDEPFADNSALPSLLLNKKVKESVTVALSGDGGDESFLGYMHFDVLNMFNKVAPIPIILRKKIAKFPWYKIFGGRPETISEILNCKNSSELAIKIFTGYSSILKKRGNNWLNKYKIYNKKSESSFQQMADLNIKLWLENDSNVKVDRASMAYSVEVRSPFLDYRVVEYARNLPVNFRYNRKKKKKIIKDILQEYIPESVFNKPKKGFSIPLAYWIRTELKAEIESKLTSSFLKKIPNVNRQLFKKQFDLHMKGKNNYSFNIWRLYLLSCWMEKYKL